MILYIKYRIIILNIMTSINDFNEIDDVDEETCDICLSLYKHKNINCDICKKCICLNCCNKMKNLYFSVKDENDKCGVNMKFIYKCPYCRNDNIKKFKDFEKDEILNLISCDIFKYVVSNLKYRALNENIKTVEYSNLQIKNLNDDNDDKKTIEFLKNELERFKDIEQQLFECKKVKLERETNMIYLNSELNIYKKLLEEQKIKHKKQVIFLSNCIKNQSDNLKFICERDKTKTIKKNLLKQFYENEIEISLKI